MAADVTRGQRIGNLLTWEVDGNKHGYCRKAFATVTVAAGMGVGACLDSSGDWIAGSGSVGGNTTMVVIDEGIYDVTDGEDASLAVLYRGPATIAKKALTFSGTTIAADYTAAAAALEVLLIQVQESIA